MFFDSWERLIRIVVVGLLAYVGLVLLLRVAGKRTLSKLNAFDLVVTVALGSTLATVLLSSDVVLLEGLLAFAILILAQYVIATLSTRSDRFRRLVQAQPRLLVYRGEFLHDALRDERLTESDLLAALRQSGVGSIADVGAVVLEADASIHVLPRDAGDAGGVLRDVEGFAEVDEAVSGG